MNTIFVKLGDSFHLDLLHGLLTCAVVILFTALVFVGRLRVAKAIEAEKKRADLEHERSLIQQAQELQLSRQELEQSYAVQLARLQTKVDMSANLKNDYLLLQTRYEDLQAEHLTNATRLDEQRKQLDDQQSLVNSARQEMLKDFQLTADRLFQMKQKQFGEQSETRIKTTLAPFAENLASFQKQIQDLHHRQASERNQLVGQIGELQKQTSKVTEEANNLARALKGDNQQQGAWGEMVLESILSRSGLEAGREYLTQSSYSDIDARTKRPDVIVNLPDNRQLIIDSKVSIVDYERAVNSVDEAQQQLAMKSHFDSVKKHIRDLSRKAYHEIEKIRTVDYVLLFIPIESAYIALLRGEAGILDIAERSKVLIVSPSTLMSTLRTVELLWQQDRQNRNAIKIAESAGRLYDQFALMTESIDGIEQILHRGQSEVSVLKKRFSTGNGNLLKRFADIKKLGVKARKQLPEPEKDHEAIVTERDPASEHSFEHDSVSSGDTLQQTNKTIES